MALTHLDMEMDESTFKHLWSSVCRWGKNQQEREELFAYCYEKYYSRIPGKEILEDKKDSYMSVLFRNACVDYMRKKGIITKHEVLLLDLDGEWEDLRGLSFDAFDQVETMETDMLTSNFLDSLFDTDRKIAQHLLDDTPYEDIAEELKIPMNTVRTKIHRYREKWRKIPQLKSLCS